MDEEINPEIPEQEIEFLEDDFEEVVDLDGEGEDTEGKCVTLIKLTWRHTHFLRISYRL